MRLVVLMLGLWLGLALAAGNNEFSLQDGLQIVQTLSDPTQYVEYFPDTDRWIPWFGQRVREYKVPIILYNMGLMLLIVGLGFLILQILSGRQSLAEVLLRLVLVGIGWQLLVLPPSMNGCSAGTEQDYPCKVRIESRKMQKQVLMPDGQGGYRVEQREVQVVEPQAPELASHRLIKGLFKNVMLAGANNAIMASLKNEGAAVKNAQGIIVELTMAAWSAAGVANLIESVPAYLRCGGGAIVGGFFGGMEGGLRGGGEGALAGCAVGSGAPEAARTVAGTLGTARSLLIMGPMLAIATFHAVNTIAGLYLYSVLFFMPLLIPLALFGGTTILATASRLALVALVTPLISGVLLSTGLGLSYSYSKQRFDELQKMAEEVKKSGIPLGAAGFAVQNNSIASLQLFNLYQCLKAERENLTTGALCDEPVSFGTNGSVKRELDQLLIEKYGSLGEAYNYTRRTTPSGYTEGDLATGEAYRRVVERATPQFSGKVLWKDLSAEKKRSLYSELEGLFKNGSATSLASNTRAMLEIFKRYQAQPDLGKNPLYTVEMILAANGMDRSQNAKVVQGLREVAFRADAKALPPKSLLEATDTWANGVETLGLMNRIHAAEAVHGDFQSRLMASLRSKMLNMVILMLTAVAITIVMLGTIGQIIGQLLLAGIAAGNAGLQMFMGGAALGAGREHIPIPGVNTRGGGQGSAAPGRGRGISTSYPAGPAPRREDSSWYERFR